MPGLWSSPLLFGTEWMWISSWLHQPSFVFPSTLPAAGCCQQQETVSQLYSEVLAVPDTEEPYSRPAGGRLQPAQLKQQQQQQHGWRFRMSCINEQRPGAADSPPTHVLSFLLAVEEQRMRKAWEQPGPTCLMASERRTHPRPVSRDTDHSGLQAFTSDLWPLRLERETTSLLTLRHTAALLHTKVHPLQVSRCCHWPGIIAAELADAFANVFNTSLSQALVQTSIILVPKESPLSCFIDDHPAALAPSWWMLPAPMHGPH